MATATASRTRPLTQRLEEWARAHKLVQLTIADLEEVWVCPWLYRPDTRLTWAENLHTAGKLTKTHAGARMREIAAELVNAGPEWRTYTERSCHMLLRRLRSIRIPPVRR